MAARLVDVSVDAIAKSAKVRMSTKSAKTQENATTRSHNTATDFNAQQNCLVCALSSHRAKEATQATFSTESERPSNVVAGRCIEMPLVAVVAMWIKLYNESTCKAHHTDSRVPQMTCHVKAYAP